MNIQEKIDINSVFDLNLSVEDFIKKLDDLLKHNRVSLIERRTILRQKTQEFKDKKLRKNADIRKRA
jgi:hypothetical protein